MPQDPTDNLSIVQAVNAFRQDSERARFERMQKNRHNRQAFRMIQDWAHKIDGQSREFIPKTSEAVDQFAAFVKRALIAFGDWFSMDMNESLITAEAARKLLRCHLENLPIGGDWSNKIDFSTVMTDACQTGILEALMVFKVHGLKVSRPNFKLEEGEKFSDVNPWNLQIDLIAPDDFFQDPTGRNLYKIHRSRRDLHDVIRLAELGVYSREAVNQLLNPSSEEDEERREDDVKKELDTAGSLDFRKQVIIDEFWGTLLNNDGTVSKRKIFCTVANEKFLLRSPKPYPFWHGEDPFVTIPLVRLAFSVNHRALADQFAPINFALNELFNLILDGGIASVWGIKQLRHDHLEDPTQVTNGISQGKTLVVKDTLPEGQKVLENVTEGEVPPDALATYRLLEQELQAGSLVNELKLGNLPTKEVRATEIVEASQSSAVMLDQIASDIERGLERLLRKAWLNIVQHSDDLFVNDLREVMTDSELLRFARATDEEKFESLVSNCSFKVFGLTATLQRAREFQKLMALIQVVGQSPILLPTALRRLSGDKIFDQLFKMVNLNPSMFQKSPEEQARAPQDAAVAQQFLGGQGSPAGVTGESGQQSLGSEIQQEASPTAGI